MYSPKIKDEIVRKLYRKAKKEGITMTKLVDEILRRALNEKELEVKGVSENEKKCRMG